MGIFRRFKLTKSTARSARVYEYQATSGPRSTVGGRAAETQADGAAVADVSGRDLEKPIKRCYIWAGLAWRFEARRDMLYELAKHDAADFLACLAWLKAKGLEHLRAPLMGGLWPTIGKWGGRVAEVFGVGLLVASTLGLSLDDPVEFVESLGIGLLIGFGFAAAGEWNAIWFLRWNTARGLKKNGKVEILRERPDLFTYGPLMLAGIVGLLATVALLLGVLLAREVFQQLLAISTGIPINKRLAQAGGLLSVAGFLTAMTITLATYNPIQAPLAAVVTNYNMHLRRATRAAGFAKVSWSMAHRWQRLGKLATWRIATRVAGTTAEGIATTFVSGGEDGHDATTQAVKDLNTSTELPNSPLPDFDDSAGKTITPTEATPPSLEPDQTPPSSNGHKPGQHHLETSPDPDPGSDDATPQDRGDPFKG